MARADSALVERRVDDILRIRLDGAEFWDVREFVRSREAEADSNWFLAVGESPMSDGQIRRYQQKADVLVQQSFERNRKKNIRQHLAKRRMLYGRAVTSGELATASTVLKDEAALLHLYDEPPHKPDPATVETDPEKAKAASLAFWQSVVCSRAALAHRIAAQQQIDRILGLATEQAASEQDAEKWSALLAAMEARAGLTHTNGTTHPPESNEA